MAATIAITAGFYNWLFLLWQEVKSLIFYGYIQRINVKTYEKNTDHQPAF